MASTLGNFLDQLHASYHRKELLHSDPLEFVHRYGDGHDQEAMALLSAVLAYGNVKQIRKSLEDVLRRMAETSSGPADFVRKLGDAKEEKRAREAFRTFRHRFNGGEDLIELLRLLARSWKQHGSMGSHFLSYLEPGSLSIEAALIAFIAEWRGWVAGSGSKVPEESFYYLLTSPLEGSCCKRWCMLLRWMGRRDDLDPGLWTETSKLRGTFPRGRALIAHQLVIPLDTHTGRISQYLGLTRRKTLNWKAAVEVTGNLARWAPADPTKYDFAISRLGILDLCQKKYRAPICGRCELVSVCKFAKGKRHPSASSRAKVSAE
jgi:uncharacterized protein (TIGR02757 family)